MDRGEMREEGRRTHPKIIRELGGEKRSKGFSPGILYWRWTERERVVVHAGEKRERRERERKESLRERDRGNQEEEGELKQRRFPHAEE